MTSPTRFFATNGYDLCTGWGTPMGQSLIDALAIVDPVRIAPGAGFSAAGGVGGPFTISSQVLTVTNGGTNVLHWTVTNNGAWLEVSTAGGTLSPGNSTLVTVNLNSVASNLTVGAYSAALRFTNLDTQLSFERDYSLAIIDPPGITTQPADRTVLDGDTALFTVQVTGGMPLYYQWQCNGTNVMDAGDFTGAATANLTVSNVSPADVGAYSVVITNAAGSTTSSNAMLSIMDSAPVITVQPADESVQVGTMATFTVAAIGSKPFYYQWSFGDWSSATNIDGATNDTLILSNAQLADSGVYFVTVSNGLGATPSYGATLTVYELPVVTSQPTNVVVAVRSNAEFSVSVSGTGPFYYQWFQNQTNSLPGAMNSTLVLTNAQATDAGLYNVVVSTPFGGTVSSNAMLAVTGFDHFGWSPIPSPRFVNGPFTVTIQALDTTNAAFTNFTGTVLFDSANGVAVNPSVSSNFVGGVWSGAVSIAQATSNLVLRADDGDGRTGLANAIDVVMPPSLCASNFESSFLVTWPIAPGGFVLETSGNLMPDSWTAVAGSPTNSDDQNFQWVPMTGTNQFFRLRFLGP
jgi:Immunoglobulin I-set domain/Viral BACON domain/Immunoglobulin domain